MRAFPLFSPFSSDLSVASHSAPVLDGHAQTEIAAFLKQLVQTPSLSGHENAVAELIVKELQSGGVEDVHIDPAGNVIAKLGSGDGPTLLYDAHMDTIHPAGGPWPHEPYAADVENGLLYGLGACDMKGAIAAMIYAARQLAQTHSTLHGSLILLFVVQEEPGEGSALQYAIEQRGLTPDWVVLGEPSNLNIMRGHRGRVLFRVTVKGKSSHSASPELGENAVIAAARLVFGIELMAADLPADPALGPGTITVTNIESQSASMHAIPHTCSLYVDRRLTLGETVTRAQAQLENMIRHEGVQATVEIVERPVITYTGHQFDVREAFHAWSIEENHSLIQAADAAARSVLGYSPSIDHWSFSTDGVYSMGEADIPTIGFGPGDPRCAHTIEEHIRLEDVAQAMRVYAALATLLLSSDAA
jgi:putative selenium metabolism hydrolase